MLLKDASKAAFLLCVMSAARKLSWKAIRTLLGTKKIEMASEAEVKALTKCIPGAVPPFGSLFGVPTYMDKSLSEQGDTINFNAGLRTFSVVNLKVSDFVALEKPTVAEFTE
jgi:Ala-tRNA(Pro) deacylase